MPDKLHPEILNVLSRLKARIQRYVFLEGLASVVALLGVLFWVSFSLDWFYFVVQREDLSRGFRTLILVATVSVVAVAAFTWILLRVIRVFRERALALVLERRFPQLNDRLITAIELAGRTDADTPLTGFMIRRTVDEVADVARELELGQVFNLRPLLRASLVALVLMISIGGFAFGFDDLFAHWFRRNVLLADEAWRRETTIEVYALAEPGDRRVEFKNGVYKHPRGGDLTILAEVGEGMIVPDQMQFRFYQLDGQARGRPYFAKLGERQFKHTLAGVLSSLKFTVVAGDAQRVERLVEVVDPPRLDDLSLDALYPAYTAWNEAGPDGKAVRTPIAIQGTQVSLPAGTDFLLRATANKPLTAIRIETDGFVLHVDRGAARLTLFATEGAARQGGDFPIPAGPGWLSPDGLQFSIPCLLTVPAPSDVVSADGQVNLPLRLPSDASLRIFLVDADDIHSLEPSRLTVNSKTDEPPKIETQLRGIGSSITRKATIPVTGRILDDYGVALARFDYKIDNDELMSEKELSKSANRATEFPLALSQAQPYEPFEVLPLELKVGQKLTLGLFAQDADNLNGPHQTHGERYTFQIVSDEELLSLLYARELNLRLRLEQILTEVTATRADLILHRGKLERAAELRRGPPAADQQPAVAEELSQLDNANVASGQRALSAVRKNHNETQAIEQSLRDIREEMINNAVDTPVSLERMDVYLINPLHGINETDYNGIDQTLGLVLLALEDGKDAIPGVDETTGQLTRLMEKIEAILVQMRRLETIKELVELLRAIKAEQEELKKKTKRKAIEDFE